MEILRGATIRRRRLYEEIAERLAKAIQEGEIKAGEALPSEREIMDAFGVGRTAVREALFSLQTDGLIHLNAGRRPVVVEPTKSIMDKLAIPARSMLIRPDRLRQLQDARTLFESALARHAARVASPPQVAAMERALRKNQAALDNPGEFVRTNIEFHFEIARSAENMFVDSLYTGVNEWLGEHRRLAIRKPGAADLAYRRHEEIFDAIKRHDSDGAERAMRTHLEESRDAYWTVMEQVGEDPDPIDGK